MKRSLTLMPAFKFLFILFIFLNVIFINKGYGIAVSNLGDTGNGSLRSAINNAITGETITFTVTGNIILSSPISVNKEVFIDGFTAPGASAGSNQIRISGAGTVGLNVAIANFKIRGITFQGFSDKCLFLSNAPNFSVQSCIFGLDNTASSVVSTAGTGIYIGGNSFGLIGGTNVGDGNIFHKTGSSGACLEVYNVNATSATNTINIYGNKFGTNYTGTSSFGLATNCGIKFGNSKYINIGGLLTNQGNQLDGSITASAIWSYSSTGTNSFINIQGNKIGTAPSGGSYIGILLGLGTNTNYLIKGNTINNCGNYAIDMSGATFVDQFKIFENSFSNNTAGGINNAYTPPVITSATTTKIMGTGLSGDYIEFYIWDGLKAAQGTTYIVRKQVDGDGTWSIVGTFAVGQKIVVTATPFSYSPSTTRFSAPFTVIACPSTATAGPDQTICASTAIAYLTGTLTNCTGQSWTKIGGTGGLANANTTTPFYILSAMEQSTTVPFTVIFELTAINNTCAAIIDQMTLTITPAPKANAGADKSLCVTATGGINLAGSSVTVATGGTWSGGSGFFSPNANTLNATYVPTAAEMVVGNIINLALTTTGNGTCTASTDAMQITITSGPTVSAGIDKTICAANANVFITGASITGAPGGTWTSSGSGTFSNVNTITTIYSPSNADKTAGSVTLRLSSTGGTCASVSDVMILTINPCLIDPQLKFESSAAIRSLGSAPFTMNLLPLNSTGAITYRVVKASDLSPTSCAAVDAKGAVTTTCLEVVRVIAYQAKKAPYDADTASYTLTIDKGITNITLESRGAVVLGADFRLLVNTNYDQALTYAVVGGDGNAISITSDGLITPLAVGTVYVQANADGASVNYNAGASNIAEVTIYPNLTKPVAVNDTINMTVADGEVTYDIVKNDYGTTASIQLSPSMLLDIDDENDGVQSKFFKTSLGIATVDALGILTFTPFSGFIGVDSIMYTVTDADGLVSEPASIVISVTSTFEQELKANEIITANNDNVNDALVIGYTDLTQGNDLLIVDAAGNRLYYKKDYKNDWMAKDQSGNELGNGVYYFIFREFTSSGTVKRELKSNFTVLR